MGVSLITPFGAMVSWIAMMEWMRLWIYVQIMRVMVQFTNVPMVDVCIVVKFVMVPKIVLMDRMKLRKHVKIILVIHHNSDVITVVALIIPKYVMVL